MPINSKRPEYLLQESDWEDCRRFYEGEKEVKGAGTIYLPKPEGQKTKEYNNDKQRAFFLGAVEPAIVGLVGAVDRKPPTVSVPTGIEDRLYDIDNDGTSLRVFSKAILAAQLLMGRVGILVDRLPEGDTPPYFVKYTAEDIYNWIEVKGVPTLVVLRETYYEQKDSDMYEQTPKTRFRELYLEKGVYKQRVWLPKGKSSAIAKGQPKSPSAARQRLARTSRSRRRGRPGQTR